MTYNPQWKKGYSFGTIAVAGQSNVVAEADPDTLTLVEGSNVTITTDAATDAVTIAAASGGVSDGDKGDITVSGSGATWTIDAGVVTLAKQADLAANSIVGNNTGAPATPMALTASQAKTLLAIAAGDVSGLGTLATQNGTFSGTSSGTNTGDQTITLTGPVTGSGTGSFATTIAATLDTIPAPVASVGFNDQQATSFRVENRTSDPGSPTTGQLWLRTDL